jgi:outer membrane lipoprotein-sorting protein
MMKKIVLFCLVAFLSSNVQAQTAESVVNKMISALGAGKAYQYTMTQSERINGKMHDNKIMTKVQYSPKKVFIDNIEGANEGVQVLYVQGERDNKALINKLFGVKLSPFNSLIRKNQHHTVLESGFGLLLSSIRDGKRRAESQNAFDQVFSLAGTVTFNGKSCYKLVLNDPTFTYVDYTIKSGESLYSIAIHKSLCEQLIVDKNGFSGFGSGKEGDTIKIPSSYAKKTIMYIDKATYHPIYQEMHDDQGLFEKYAFYNLQVNPAFVAKDFSEDNSEYNF